MRREWDHATEGMSMTNRLEQHTGAMRRLGTYLMAAGGVGLVAGEAGAVVVDIAGIGNITANNGQTSLDIDVDGNAVNDFTVTVADPGGIAENIFFQGIGVGNEANRGQRGTCLITASYANNVAPGTAINAALGASWGQFNVIWDKDRIADCNNFVTGVQGILPIRFMRGGNQHYGYLKVTRNAGSNILNIAGGAYESTPGGAIAANDTTNVQPTSVPVGPAVPIGVSLLIAGAAALRHRRQRKTH